MHDYVPLHVHSQYEIGQSTISVPELVSQAKEKGFKALALTGHNVMFGIPQFEECCRKHRIHPLIGCEVDVAWGGPFESCRLILLAETQEGYSNLIQLSTDLHWGFDAGLTLEFLECYKAGLIAIIPLAMMRLGEECVAKIAEIYGRGKFFCEIPMQSDEPLQIGCSAYPSVPGHAVRYLNPDDEAVFRGTSQSFFDEESQGAHLPTADEIEYWQKRWPEAVANSSKIAELCNATSFLRFTEEDWPEFEDAKSATAKIKALCRQHIARLYPTQQDKAEQRLDAELEMASQNGLLLYLLILLDISEYIRSEGIQTFPNWVSQTGSIFYFLLGISPVDPLRFKLLPPESFSKSLWEEPLSIVINVGTEGRMKLIGYLNQKYRGRLTWTKITRSFGIEQALEKAAEICEVEMQAAVKIGKELMRLQLEMLDRDPLLEITNESHPLHHYVASNPRISQLFQVAIELCGKASSRVLYRNVLILAPKKLRELIPLDCFNHRHQMTSQYSAGSLEKQGFLKIELWNSEFACMVEEMLLRIRANGKIVPVIAEIPLDEQTFFAEVALQQEQSSCVSQCWTVNLAIEKSWNNWFEAEHPDEYAIAGQKVREEYLRCYDGV
ncbi:MAG: PHP domain-containing protein [Negativicutes bacterium]